MFLRLQYSHGEVCVQRSMSLTAAISGIHFCLQESKNPVMLIGLTAAFYSSWGFPCGWLETLVRVGMHRLAEPKKVPCCNHSQPK